MVTSKTENASSWFSYVFIRLYWKAVWDLRFSRQWNVDCSIMGYDVVQSRKQLQILGGTERLHLQCAEAASSKNHSVEIIKTVYIKLWKT